MKIKVVELELEWTASQRRALRWALVLGAVAASISVGVAFAKPKQFMAGETIHAADINAAFGELDTRLSALEGIKSDQRLASLETGRVVGKVAGKALSSGLTQFCGATAQTYLGGSIGGYTGAKGLCEGTCTSPSAHMCTVDEIHRLEQLGVPPKRAGWISGANGPLAPSISDCLDWTHTGSAQDDARGTVWDPNVPAVWQSYCWQSPNPILCCD